MWLLTPQPNSYCEYKHRVSQLWWATVTCPLRSRLFGTHTSACDQMTSAAEKEKHTRTRAARTRMHGPLAGAMLGSPQHRATITSNPPPSPPPHSYPCRSACMHACCGPEPHQHALPPPPPHMCLSSSHSCTVTVAPSHLQSDTRRRFPCRLLLLRRGRAPGLHGYARSIPTPRTRHVTGAAQRTNACCSNGPAVAERAPLQPARLL